MTTNTLRRVALTAALTLAASAALAQSTHFTLDLGYQGRELNGNENMYRSQSNVDEGFVLREFSLSQYAKPGDGAIFDSVRVNASGFGAATYGMLGVVAERAGLYRVNFSATHYKQFNALPGYANPFVAKGITLGQHTLDGWSDNYDLNLEVFPGRAFTPIVGLRSARSSNHQTTTYHVGEDEFLLNAGQDQGTKEARLGFTFNAAGIQGTVMHGWRWYDITDSAVLGGPNAGNNTRPVLGRNITMSGYSRESRTDGSVPLTTVYVSSRVLPEVRVIGSYVHAEYVGETNESEKLSGSLASFALSRFFSGMGGATHGRSESPDWRGEVRVETEFMDGLEINAGYRRHHRAMDGWSLISEMYTGTVNFVGADPKDVARVLEASSAFDRNENVIEATVSTRNLGPLHVWGGWAKTDQSVTVNPDASEIFVPGGQGGNFDREIKRISAGADVAFSGVKLALDWKKDDADRTIVRTDFRTRERTRARATWKLAKLVNLVATAEEIKADNSAAGVAFTTKTKHYGGDVDFTPFESLGVRAGYSVYKADSSAIYRIPQDFTLGTSVYSEDGKLLDAGVTYKLAGFDLGATYSKFKNSGTTEFDLERGALNLGFDVTKKLDVTLVSEWHEYREFAFAAADFRAKRYGVFFRWHE